MSPATSTTPPARGGAPATPGTSLPAASRSWTPHHGDTLVDGDLAIDVYGWPNGQRTAVLVDGSCEDLSPEQMRRLARLLCEAADLIEE